MTISLPFGLLQAIPQEDQLARRVQAHLALQDLQTALEEAQQALKCYPQSAVLLEKYIQVLAGLGCEKEMVNAWETYIQFFPDKALERGLIEDMAWGVLTKAAHSSSLVMREMGLLAAYFSQQTKSVSILYQGLRDSNYAIRAMAVKFASHYHDYKLIEEIKRLFRQERIWSVRQQVLKAIGRMKIMELRADLETLIASDESSAEEKALAIDALLKLLDTINRTEVERLVASHRAGLRLLACESIAYFQSMRDLDQLFILVTDASPHVRREALQAIGKLKPQENEEVVLNCARLGMQDAHPEVALSAAWLLTLYRPDESRPIFVRYLQNDRREVRALAAAALSATGRYGLALMQEQFRLHPDAYVRLNLALGLIGQREMVEEAAACVKSLILTEKERWGSLECGIFEAVINRPSRKEQDPSTTPEMENQLARLQLLNLLAVLKTPDIEQVIRQYLIERSWGISATATAVLLTEGDETAVEAVQMLLKDPQPRVRLQAALVLSMWSREESAIQALEEGYVTPDRELKARILEGLGRIGSMRSVPFLIQTLKEPSQTLRLIAAMALIQCLNH